MRSPDVDAAPAARRLCVVLHDVSPSRWRACCRVLQQVEAVARRCGVTVPMTLLVVPQMHGRQSTPPAYAHWLRGLAERGHELALHGLTHRDPGRPRSWIDRLRRRVYTAGEGEFAALPKADARQRIARALQWARQHGVEARGFVPPAWLMDAGAREAIAQAGFAYTCTQSRLLALPGGQAIDSFGLTFSTRTRWRRRASVAWNTMLERTQRGSALLRLELHPHDADDAGVRRCWTTLLERALGDRTPVPLRDAAELAREAGGNGGRGGGTPASTPSPAPLRALHESRGTALVAGAAGFVGSHLCDRLLGEGWHVVGVDNLATGSHDHLAHLAGEARFRFVEHDITEPLPASLAAVDRVFNLACPASPAAYQRHPVATVLASTVGTWRLLELAMARRARLLHVSTSEVYGDPQVHPQPESYWGHVNPTGPRSCYDEGKRCAEAMCFACMREHGADVRIARLFNCYGPRLRAGDGRVVSNFIVQALAGRPLTVYGDGRQTRSFCFVDDTVEGLLRLMDSGWREPVNLGNPQELSMLELAQRVLALSGSRSKLVFEPLPADDPVRRRPDITTAQRELGWQPRITLDDGLARTIAHFRALQPVLARTGS